MICCVCLNKAEFEISIFDEDSSGNHIAAVIQKHFWFSAVRNDMISTVICQVCWQVIREFNEFYETIRAAHKLHCEQHGLPDEIRVTKTEYVEVESIEQAHESADIDLIDNEYQDSNMLIHKNEDFEPIDVLYLKNGQPVSNNQTDESSIDDDNTDQDHKPDEKELKNSNKILKKPVKKAKKFVSKKVNTEQSDSPKVKQENRWSNEKSAEIIRKHLNLKCDICSFPSQTFGELVKHFQVSHVNIKAYIQCCGRRYHQIQRVAQHAYKHEDPKSFQCNVCQKTFSNTYSMRSHTVAYHPTEDQLNFQCDQCEKRFSMQRLLDQHLATHVPLEACQYACTQCQKLFASEHRLKAHISLRHENATNVCHICAKTIRDNYYFKKHVMDHLGQKTPRVKCPYPGCEKFLKDKENLKVHLLRHTPGNFPCEQCKKPFKTRMELRKHKLYTHAQKQFSCNLCSKSFKRKITFNEHMATHTGEPLYKCPFCERTFNSNANMYSHKKKQHPAEWDQWHKTKTQSLQ